MTQSRFLFIYGTLRPGSQAQFGRAMRRRLEAESRLVGPATLSGQLINLGRYPGLIETEDKAVVLGDLVKLDAPKKTWPWLDAYEGIDPDKPEASDYVRVVREARRQDGETCASWVYVLQQRPTRLVPIASGDWLAP
jgi:gamma-glutamylcyclotransferase (GGCT)/AIG2-like uncharacterized protein YtfP